MKLLLRRFSTRLHETPYTAEVILETGANINIDRANVDAVRADLIIDVPNGLKKLPYSFTSEDAIADELFFSSVEVSDLGEFEKSIKRNLWRLSKMRLSARLEAMILR